MGSSERMNILVTSGSMRGYIDSVRYVSNRSTGRLGAAIATEALINNAFVTFVYGVGSAIPDKSLLDTDCVRRLTLIEIETIDDLLKTLLERLKEIPFDTIIHAMAVLDYVPVKQTQGKISSHNDTLTITFTKTPKIIRTIRALWQHAFLVGFKLEAGLQKEELTEKAYTSLIESGADFIVANDQTGIFGNTHKAYLINSGKKIEFECETKQEISKSLMDMLLKNYKFYKPRKQFGIV